MKCIYFPIIAFLLFSCTTDPNENACFEDEHEGKTESKTFRLDTPQEILQANPSHVKFTLNENPESYEEEMEEDQRYYSDAERKKRSKANDIKYAELIKNFGQQFIYKNIEKTDGIIYGLGENVFGYWLLEVKNNVPDAYYLGLSRFTHLSKKQPERFVSGKKMRAYGNFLRISKSWGYPFGPAKEAVKDRLAFELDLDAIKKDSDKDRFNDLFEKLVLLNPNSADTDKDGIPDFTDSNPLYQSEKSKFTDLYAMIIDQDYETFDLSESNYFFAGYFSDCEYFQKISPAYVKVLVYPEKERSAPESDYRLGIFHDHLGKIRKDKDKNRFFIDYGNGAGGGFIEALFINGQWTLSRQSTYSI